MTYSPVKSDPWRKGLSRPRLTLRLWSDDMWKRLVQAAQAERGFHWSHPNLSRYKIGPACSALIRSFNEHARPLGALVIVYCGLVRAGDPGEAGAARELRPLLGAIRQVETGGHPDPANAVGDHGRSIGPYQIQRAYWQDSRVPGRWEDVRDRAYAERVMCAYWARYCPAALESGDWQTLARIHNGGPRGARRKATLEYWRRVKERMQ